MKRNKFTFIFILLVILLICSCNMDPELSGDAEKIVTVGVHAVSDVMNKYNEIGSYPGLTIVEGSNYVLTLNFSNCTTTVDLSEYGLGTKTVTIDNQVVLKYEAYPELYPASQTFNIKFQYDGSSHTMEMKIRMTGVSSGTVTGIKIDGKKYKDHEL